MPDLQCLKVRIKEGKTGYVRDWIRGMKDRDLHGLNLALTNEGMLIETIFLELTRDGDYLIVYQRAEDLVRANQAFKRSKNPFDEDIRAFIEETWGEAEPLELLVDHERTIEGYRHTTG